MKKKITPAMFGLALICFLLPWTTVSCQKQEVFSLNGVQLVVGKTINTPSLFDSRKTTKLPGEKLALFAALAIISGLIASLSIKSPEIAAAILGTVSTVCLLLLIHKVRSDILSQGKGMLEVSFHFGFFMTLILSMAAAAYNGYLFRKIKIAKTRSEPYGAEDPT